MRILAKASPNAGKTTPVLTWLLAALAFFAVAWVWWRGSHPLQPNPPLPFTPAARPVLGPSAPSRTEPSQQRAAETAWPIEIVVQTALPPVIVTSLVPSSSMVANSHATILATVPTNRPVTSSNPDETEARVRCLLDTQLSLARLAISPGSLDGRMGSQTRAALRAFQEREGLAPTGDLDSNTLARLALPVSTLTSYVVTAADVSRLRPLGRTWLAKSEQPRLDYETVLELVAERFASSPRLIQRLNPGTDWNRAAAGTTLVVPNYEPPRCLGKADFLKIHLREHLLQAFDRDNQLLAQFPCSIAQKVEKRPAGETLRVVVVAPNPNYTFNPEVFPESPEARSIGRKLVICPGPNNPVGTVWIGLDKAGYGIHGTPKPEEVGRTESHGCFRLANWNAEHLLKLVVTGTPVLVEP